MKERNVIKSSDANSSFCDESSIEVDEHLISFKAAFCGWSEALSNVPSNAKKLSY